MSHKIFIMTFFLICTLGLGSLASFNYFINPLWTFDHAHEYNDVQITINERQQKVNQIHHSDNFEDYDTLLLGSSRTTYINPHDFKNMDVYNFAVSDLSFKEYKSMIDFAKEEKGSSFERIIIGADFNKSSKKQSEEDLSLDEYIANAHDPFYRWKNLISLDVFEYAKKNFRLSKNDKNVLVRSYNRNNTAFAKEFQESSVKEATKAKAKKFRNQLYGENYEYNPEFREVLEELKRENPDTEFIIFTTPVATQLYEAMVKEGNLQDYNHWLNEIIDVFGGVHHFMYPNSVTGDLSNYFDGNHFYPNVGKMIAARISGDSSVNVPEDFGRYVTEKIPAE